MPISSSSDDLATAVYRFLADCGPLTAPAVVKALGRDGERVAAAMARLPDAQRLMMAGVTPADEPLYAVAAEQSEEEQEGRAG